MKRPNDKITTISTAALVGVGAALVALALGACGSKESSKATEPEVTEAKAPRIPTARTRPSLPDQPELRERAGDEDRPRRDRPRLGDGEKWNTPDMAARREEMMQRRGEMMKEYDKDGDGQLNDDERAAMRTARVGAMFTQLDADGDGKISPDEAENRDQGGRRLRNFEGIDTDGDGFLSEQELQNMPMGRPGRGMRGGPDGVGRGWRDRNRDRNGDSADSNE